MIWINMAPAKHEEGTILVNPPLLYDLYCPREALKVCPTVILLNLYDIRKMREREIRSEKTDVIAILSTIFSTKIDHKKKDAILKERGFTLNEKEEQEMTNMESGSKDFFESLKDDIKEAVRRELPEDGRKDGRKDGREDGKVDGYYIGVEETIDIYVLFADGKSDEEIIKAFPKLPLAKVKKQRQKFEKLKMKMTME